MRLRMRLCWMLLLSLTAQGLFAAENEPSPADLLPATTVFYTEMPDPAALLSVVWDHPLRRRVEQLEEYREATQAKNYLAFQGMVQYVESQFGQTWREALAGLTAQGVVLAFDSATEGVALLIRARDESTLAHIRDVAMELTRADAKQKGRDDPYRQQEYRGLTVYQAGDGYFATIGDRLIVVNKPDLGRVIADRLLDASGAESLATQPRFAAANAVRPRDASVWAWSDVEWVRTTAAARGKPFQTQTDNPVGELLIGGLLDTFQQTPWLSADLRVTPTEAALRLCAPHQADWVTEPRAYYFGPTGGGAAPAPLQVRQSLFTLGAYRNLSEMWLRAGELFPENIVDKFAEADSTLALFFSGRDFGEEILGAFEPTLQIVAARQTFADDRPTPAIRLPAFAVQFELREPGTMQRELKRTFQSIVGFANVTGAMEGNPQLELDMPAVEGFELTTAHFLPRVGEEQSREAPIQFNFSPSVASAGTRFILASTEALARELAASATAPAATGINTRAELQASVLRQSLADNRSHLVTQNMLKEGHTQAEAERAIELLLEILDLFRDVTLKLSAGDGRLLFELGLRLQGGK